MMMTRFETDPPGGGKLSRSRLVLRPAFEQDRADDSALHRAAHPLPDDWWAGVVEQPSVHLGPDLSRRADVLPDGVGREDAAEGFLDGGADPRPCASWRRVIGLRSL